MHDAHVRQTKEVQRRQGESLEAETDLESRVSNGVKAKLRGGMAGITSGIGRGLS